MNEEIVMVDLFGIEILNFDGSAKLDQCTFLHALFTDFNSRVIELKSFISYSHWKV